MTGSSVAQAATVALVDLALVVAFAAVGRTSHGEAVDAAGLAATAGPFVVGWLVGLVLLALVPVSRNHPLGVAAGVLVWASTVGVGLVARHVTGGGTPLSFVVVTAVVLGVFLLGWRGAVALVSRSRARAGAHTPV